MWGKGWDRLACCKGSDGLENRVDSAEFGELLRLERENEIVVHDEVKDMDAVEGAVVGSLVEDGQSCCGTHHLVVPVAGSELAPE